VRTACLTLLAALAAAPAMAADWTSWRGPTQNSVSSETGLVTSWSPDGDNVLWTHDIASRGAPVVFDGTAYVWGYRGEGPDLVEVLVAMKVDTGEVVWERQFRDFLSDIIYDRYSIGSPTVDPSTGHVFLQSSNGVLMAFDADGNTLWEVSMMEAWGRLTFPNGRTGAPLVVGDLVIVHGITAHWGAQGPARDRFYAFDKSDGTAVWVSTPGTAPKDSSFSTPVLAPSPDGSRLLLYAGTGCGNVVAVDVATGAPVWRHKMSAGGVNVSLVLDGNHLIATHAKENLDSTKTGRMIALDVSAKPTAAEKGTPVLAAELWRADVSALSSSPIVQDGVVYQVDMTGELRALDLETGAELWHVKLGPDQLHASPVWADGHLYIPLHDGSFHIVRVAREGGEVVSRVQLEGKALGAPSISDGRIYVATTKKLYVFGKPAPTPTRAWQAPTWTTVDPVVARVRPAEVLLRPAERADILVELLDPHGNVVSSGIPESMNRWIPPTAKVKSEMNATYEGGVLMADAEAGLSAGAWQAGRGELIGVTRGRTVAGVGFVEDLEGFDLVETDPDGAAFAYPPLPWIGARFKWQVREVGGTKVLAKTLDRMLFQRSTTFIGHPDEHSYTLTADVMTDGNRRVMSAVGVVNQRYRIVLKGNQRRLEVASNQERLKEGVPFEMRPGTWYRLTTQVQVRPDGTAVVRAKAWPRDESEPEAWTIEVEHANGHTQGAPGLFGFSPQNLHRVYIDNVAITRTPGEAP
jgi:outer membrane protein assembly factor BamB